MDRHGRQTRLDGVGSAGQARIAAARVDVCLDGLRADVAARYLVGAGVGTVRVRSEPIARAVARIDPAVRVEAAPGLALDASDVAFDLRDPVARDVAAGARAALKAIRAILAGEGGEGAIRT